MNLPLQAVFPARFFGRAFTILGFQIDPCSACGTPLFPFRRHTCVGLDDHIADIELAQMLEEEED